MSVFNNPAASAAGGADSYVTALLELLGSRTPVEVLTSTTGELRMLLVGRTATEMRTPEGPGRWSAVEVLQHLADSDLVWAYRMRMILAHDRPTITGYDQDAWADQLAYATRDAGQAFAQFTNLRSWNLQLIRALGPDSLARVGVHNERGEESLEQMLKLYAGHDLVHLRQLGRILGQHRS